MSILITGGTGFIGSYLVKELLKRNKEVVIFDNMLDTSLLGKEEKRCKFVRGDLSYSSDVYSAVFENKVTDIFHLASLLAEVCEEKPLAASKVNIGGTARLLEAAKIGNVKRFIFASSISVFGKEALEPVCDTARKNPTTVYGITKLAGEHLCLWYHKKHKLDIRGVRFPWVFGPGRKRGITRMYSSWLLDCIARGKELEVKNPEEKGDWLYVKDAVKALCLAWGAEDPKQLIYNISGGTHSIREVMEIAKSIVPNVIIRYGNSQTTFSPYPSSYNDQPARDELGWSPSYSIEQSVREHLEIMLDSRKSSTRGINI